jgi:uncharacterized protein (TIGR03067 family)
VPGTRSVVFEGTRCTFYSGKAVDSSWEIKLNPAKKWLDLKAGEHSVIGIYRLKGDTLTCALRQSLINPVRPTTFDLQDAGIKVWKRKKP